MLEAFLLRLRTEGRVDVIVRVRPHAAQSKFVALLQDGSLKIDVAAPAEDGRGNAALKKFIGTFCGVPPSNVTILSGKTARVKLVRIHSANAS